MKVKLGTRVQTEFGGGPIVAMSQEWCIVRREDSSVGRGEIAVTWDNVYIPAEPGEAASSIEEKELEVSLCPECNEPQVRSPSGLSCKNGHGY